MKLFKYSLLIIFSLVFINFNLLPLQAATSSPISNMDKQNAAFNKTAGFQASDLGTIISLVIKTILGLLAVIFLVLIISAGFKWMTAGGNEQQIKDAQGTIKTAIIGLLIVLAAYSVTYFIFNNLPFNMAAPTNITTSG